MNIQSGAYLVGGAVRDLLLGHEPADRDWVVVGSSPAEMLALGFRQVGADFPVFLHPETGEEYALARRERKVGDGHRGFAVTFGPDVTLEEDLRRRDLTINAIAMDAAGAVIDPFGGVRDLNAKVLRACDPKAFADDPLRVLRLARFRARFWAFEVHEETEELARAVVARSDLAHLSAERVYSEIAKALTWRPSGGDAYAPSIFFNFLERIGALNALLPEISALRYAEHSLVHHPEGTHSNIR